MISTMRNTVLTLLCAGLVLGNFGCGQKDEASTTPPAPPTTAAPTPTTPPATTNADATKPDAPVAAIPGKDAPANAGKMDAKPAKTSAKTGKTVKMADGLEYTDTKIGDGKEAVNGATVVVNYTGTLKDGSVFDSSIGKAPFDFMLGGGNVIKGWDEGVKGMKVGGIRKLVIPSELGYGKTSPSPKIPPDSTLLFTVTLLEVR